MNSTVNQPDSLSVHQQWTEIARNFIGTLLLQSVIYFHFQRKKDIEAYLETNFNTTTERKGQDCSQKICLNLVAKATVANCY